MNISWNRILFHDKVKFWNLLRQLLDRSLVGKLTATNLARGSGIRMRSPSRKKMFLSNKEHCFSILSLSLQLKVTDPCWLVSHTFSKQVSIFYLALFPTFIWAMENFDEETGECRSRRKITASHWKEKRVSFFVFHSSSDELVFVEHLSLSWSGMALAAVICYERKWSLPCNLKFL